MWNHAQNCIPTGDDDINERDPNSNLKDKLEKCLDLTHYLKYLDQLFSQRASESESSDSNDGERNRTFNDFVQPPAQPTDRAQSHANQNHLAVGNSTISDSYPLSTFASLKTGTRDDFHLEANISSSSLSSVDSGTSSLSLTLSSDNGIESGLGRAEETSSRHNNGTPKSPHFSTESNSSSTASEDKSNANKSEKNKKSQKKKKPSKNGSESLPRQHKPSSGGNGNGSKGGGAGGLSTGGGSGDSSAGGSSSSSQGFSGSTGSPGAKSRSGTQSLQQSNSNEVVQLAHVHHVEKSTSKKEYRMEEPLQQAMAETDKSLNSEIRNPDELLLNEDLTNNFSSELLVPSSGSIDVFDANGMNSFPVLDIHEDESDYISLAATPTTAMSHASSLSQSSTNFFSKIASKAASSALSNRRNITFAQPRSLARDNSQSDGKKRKFDGNSLRSPPDKVAKLTEKQKQTRIQLLNAKRRKIYVYISRKEVGKTQRNRAATFKESLAMKRKLAHACARHMRKMALQSQKAMKASVCKAKRLTQEMEAHWKTVERRERDVERKKVKEAEEKLKVEWKIMTDKLQERKLNRLITQVELFSAKLLHHSCSLNRVSEILDQLDEVKDEKVARLDNYDSEKVKSSVQATVDRALKEHQNLVQLLDMSGMHFAEPFTDGEANDLTQPQMFEGVLKNYQMKGMNWIKRLYMMGLNGILADEAGLGKKAQIIAFFSHLAECLGLWGPFLVIAPTNSLQKWQQEFERMSPRFKVVSYWGKPMERKILRQFWERNGLHKEEACFHVVVTSYQVMVTDLKYFSKVKWQYLVMDDSQGAITSSANWMSILSFRCRNKLLLTCDPRLNSPSHLCSSLYFIMPSLFDSEEFSDWLLKELESPKPDSKMQMSEESSARLQEVMQQFLLRRVKEEVENEATQNVDFQLFCTLSRRQREVLNDLLGRLDLQHVLKDLEKCKPEEIRSRINEVLQLSVDLRKTCNHPDLIRKKRNYTSLWMDSVPYPIPKIISRSSAFFNSTTDKRLLENTFCIYNPINVHRSLFAENLDVTGMARENSTWSFVRMLGLSYSYVEDLYLKRNFARLIHLVNFKSVLDKVNFENYWRDPRERNDIIEYKSLLVEYSFRHSEVLSKLVFTTLSSSIYGWGDQKIFPLPDAIEHRSLRSRTQFSGFNNPHMQSEIRHMPRKTITRYFQPLKYPKLLGCYIEKICTRGFQPLVTCEKSDTIQGQMLPPKLTASSVVDETSPMQNGVSELWEGIQELDLARKISLDCEQLIYDSGKLKRLDGILTNLKRNENCVLLCSYIPETVALLEEFLTLRRWKYHRITDEVLDHHVVDTFVYLLSTQSCAFNISNLSIDTVIFYDQDWDTRIDYQKSMILSKLDNPKRMNCYRLVCKGTIEERMMRLAKERNIASLALCKDVIENTQVSSIPLLKSLVSVLMDECNNDKYYLKCHPRSKKDLLNDNTMHAKKGNSKKPNSYASDIHTSSVYDGLVDILDFVNVAEGSDSASPCYSEELDSGETDGDIDIKECHEEDNFSFSFDEGYMGMSPDSYDEVAIKSDYEEDSSPKKAKMGRGAGKRGRPPSRVRFQIRDRNDESQNRRGPGRPRLKPIGPANQGMRGRRPGRPPLSKKAESLSTGLSSLSSGHRVFGFYSSPDLELS